jgi:hypothetical protein
MGNKKLKIARTDATILLSNVRGEVGEVITSWLLMRNFMAIAAQGKSGDLEKDFNDPELRFWQLMKDKLRDELVGRLSELAEPVVGQLTFYFATRKIQVLMDEADAFTRFVDKNRLKEKRNKDISHKQAPEQWTDRKDEIRIPYRTLMRAVALAVRLMKRIDKHVLGRSAVYLWHEGRKRRYSYMYPPRLGYALLPHLNLEPRIRVKLVGEELRAGRNVLEQIPTMINGRPGTVWACKEWGVIVLPDGRPMPTDNYPLVSLASIEQVPEEEIPVTASEPVTSG